MQLLYVCLNWFQRNSLLKSVSQLKIAKKYKKPYLSVQGHPRSVCLSVRLSVTRVDQSQTVQAKITKFSPSAAWKTLV